MRMNVLDARVVGVATQFVYRHEGTHLHVGKIGVSFPVRLLPAFIWRFTVRHLLWDFGLIGALSLVGFFAVLLGVISGPYHWWRSIETGVTATTVVGSVAIVWMVWRITIRARFGLGRKGDAIVFSGPLVVLYFALMQGDFAAWAGASASPLLFWLLLVAVCVVDHAPTPTPAAGHLRCGDLL